MTAQKRNLRRTVFTLGMLTMSLAQAGSFTLTADTWLQGAWFQAGSILTTFEQATSPTPERGKLAQQYTAAPIIWEKDRAIVFDNQMNVMEGTVATGKYGDIPLTPGSLLNFYPNRTPISITLNQSVKLSAYGVEIVSPAALALYPNGSIRVASPNSPFLFVTKGSAKRYFLASGPTQFWPAETANGQNFLNAGTVKQGKLFGDHIHILDVFPTGSTVGFDGAGELTYLQCPVTCSYKRILMINGGTVEILPTGFFTLIAGSPVTIGGHTYPAWQKLLLTPEAIVIAASAPQ